jgi:cytochrome b561
VFRNSAENYGIITVGLHWAMAIVVLALFAVGLWMVELSYYDPWYRRAPEIHKAVGVILFLTLVFRYMWRLANPLPRPEPTLSTFERSASHATHVLFYLLLAAVMVSGYLISTADGRSIDVFGLFAIPATLTGLPSQADVAGDVHFYLAVTLIGLAAIHALAALKHHFLDRDRTLLRMLGLSRSPKQSRRTKDQS